MNTAPQLAVSFRETLETVCNLANNQAPSGEDAAKLLLTMSDGLDQQMALLDKTVNLCLDLMNDPPALLHRKPIPESIPVAEATRMAQHVLRVALLAVSEVLVSSNFTRLEQIRKDGIVVPKLADAGQDMAEWQALYSAEPQGAA
jgi:hypothetical protein